MKVLERKGSTLLELTIVISILAIVSVLCVTFSSLTNRYSLSITTQETALSDFDEIKKIYETWASSLDFYGSVIYVDDENYNLAYSKSNSTTYTLQLSKIDGELMFFGSMPADNGLKKRQLIYECMGQVTEVSFDWNQNKNTGAYVLCLKVEYNYYDKTGRGGTNLKTGTRYFLKSLKAATVQEGSF